MRIITTIKEIEHSIALEKYIEKKITTLKKYINILKKDEVKNTLAEVFIDVSKETKHHKKGDIFLVKAKIVLPKKVLFASYKADDIFKSVDGVKEELKIEIEKYKFKKIDKNRKLQRKMKSELIN